MAADKTSPAFARFGQARGAVGAWYGGLATRERRLVLAAALVLGLGLIWWLAVAPAWQTLREAPARHAALNGQLSRMLQLAQTAEGLRAASSGQPPGRDEALRALEAATASLGSTGQVSVLGDRATLTLRQTEALALAGWLQQVRVNARLLPLESQLTRDGAGATWSGTLVLGGTPLAGN